MEGKRREGRTRVGTRMVRKREGESKQASTLERNISIPWEISQESEVEIDGEIDLPGGGESNL